MFCAKGDWPIDAKMPLIGGHEGAGVVVALGDGADQFVKVGDRVGIKWIADSCLACDFCRRGHEMVCPDAQCSGYTWDGTVSNCDRSRDTGKADRVIAVPTVRRSIG